MHELIYTSVAAERMSTQALSDLLVHARSKNGRIGVTGMLLYKKGTFLQVLEGPRQAVRALYETIVDDERHGHLTLLADDPIPERRFGAWTMGFHNVDDVPEAALPEGHSRFMSEGFEADGFEAAPSYVRDTLAHFRDITPPPPAP